MAKNILIIEDEIWISALLRDFVTRFGYNVVDLVRFGEKVIEIIEKSNPKPDLILSDIYLAGALTGIDSAKMINEKYDIPIVFITAYSDDITKAQMAEVKHEACFYKPFDEEELKKKMHEILGE
ncbi:MAG: response regulator [Bacteroidia bacterium]|nr:response regulator [Bacteroidia bacterium]